MGVVGWNAGAGAGALIAGKQVLRLSTSCFARRAVVSTRTPSAEAYWTPWSTFVGDVLSGSLAVSPWCRMQVERLGALGPSPRDWPTATEDTLPAAARESMPAARG